MVEKIIRYDIPSTTNAILYEASKIKGISSNELISKISMIAIKNFCKEFIKAKKNPQNKAPLPKELQNHKNNLEDLKSTIIKETLPKIEKELKDISNLKV